MIVTTKLTLKDKGRVMYVSMAGHAGSVECS
jgi:hypothetical protein